jgi:hypothetical protein
LRVGAAWLALAGALALVASPIEAFASAGCDAVNSNTNLVSFAIPGSTPYASQSFSGEPFTPVTSSPPSRAPMTASCCVFK